MTVPTGLLADLAHHREVELRRHADAARQRAVVRSGRPPTVVVRVARRLAARTVATREVPRLRADLDPASGA